MLLIAVVGAVAVGGLGGDGSNGVSGSFTTKDGWKYRYSASFGSASTKAGKNNCPPSPKPGTVNLEFTLTIKNETSGRSAPIPTVAAWSNVLDDGTVAVPSPDPANPPDNGTGLAFLRQIGFIDDSADCSPGMPGQIGSTVSYSGGPDANVLKPGASRTYRGYVSEIPQKIPKGTSVIFMAGDFSFVTTPAAYWVLHYGKAIPNPPTTSTTSTTTTTQAPTTTTTIPRTTTTARAASNASCSTASIANVLANGQWVGVDPRMASNLAVDMTATKFTADGKWSRVVTKNLPTSPGYQPPIGWFNCVGSTWTYVTYGETPGPSCSRSSEELKAAIKELTGGTCYPG